VQGKIGRDDEEEAAAANVCRGREGKRRGKVR